MTDTHADAVLSQFLKKFSGQVHVPPFPNNIHVLMRALADEDMDTRKLAALILNYPVITARLISLANSAWASPTIKVTNVESACIRLGRSVVKGVGLAIAVSSSFNTTRCACFDPVRFWTTSMLVSEGAGLLVSHLPNQPKQADDLQYTAQTAGVLHNLGLLWLADNLAVETAQAFQLRESSMDLTVNQALMQSLGIDYCTIGGWIGQQWKLPEVLVEIMQYHRDPEYKEGGVVLVLLVGAAAKMVNALYQPDKQLPDNPYLLPWGIDTEIQQKVFNRLIEKQESIQKMAATLF